MVKSAQEHEPFVHAKALGYAGHGVFLQWCIHDTRDMIILTIVEKSLIIHLDTAPWLIVHIHNSQLLQRTQFSGEYFDSTMPR